MHEHALIQCTEAVESSLFILNQFMLSCQTSPHGLRSASSCICCYILNNLDTNSPSTSMSSILNKLVLTFSLSFDHNTCFYLQVCRRSTRNLLHGREVKSPPLRRTLSGGKLLILCYCFVLRPRSLAAGERGCANTRGEASPRMISLFRFRETVHHGRAFSLPKGMKRWLQLPGSSCVEKVCAN